jgi:hypothetical protein
MRRSTPAGKEQSLWPWSLELSLGGIGYDGVVNAGVDCVLGLSLDDDMSRLIYSC